jgi:cytochrome c556
MKHLFLAATAITLLAACNDQAADGNAALNAANASGNAASNAIENAVNQSAATPMQKEQALALMKKRHEDYERIGKAMRAAKKGLDGNDMTAVRTAAATINELAPQVQSWFPAGTGPDVGKTEAKAEIWQKPDDFAAKARDFAAAARNFNAAAQGSDVAAVRAAHADLGKSCKACHDLYREEH